jgi:eukaryotic-like serine/threonine-protein kinase
MNIHPDRWAHIKALFERTVDLPVADREAHIAEASLDPAELAELRSLLTYHDRASAGPAFMAGNAAEQLAEPAEGPTSAALPGQRLGAWEIVRPLGSGGMGEVFEVRRADSQYEGRAAVKLLKRGMDSAAVLQRFAQERQALARLSHPHIARLLDAGASADGLPYVVMEFVDGRPIDQAVRGVALEVRLQLFLQLANAVAYAHRHLLVHRDLKPGNVLVDADGQVKLLDFGIAKALDPLEAAFGHDGHTTLGGVRPYTPHYASPEQVRGEPVSTATDIYSLGVLLYQLLTGTRPTGRHARTPAEAARGVLEDAPTRPSRLTPDDTGDPLWLQTRRKLEGDLDNILLKTLEKTIERRYASVDALAADIVSYLQGRPVTARAASPGYVLSKFVQRHRWPVLAAGLGLAGLGAGLAGALLQGRPAAALGALGVLGLAVGLGLALVQARRAQVARDGARTARDEARAARDEAHLRLADIRGITRDLVFRFGDSVSYLPGGMAIKEALLSDVLRSLDRLVQHADGPDRDPALMADVACTYARLAELQFSDQALSLGKADAARTHADLALALGVPLLPLRPTDWRLASWLARAHLVLAQVHRAGHELGPALQALQRADSVMAAADLRDADDLGRTTVLGQRASTLITQAQVRELWALGRGEPATAALEDYARAAAVYTDLAGQRDMLERLDATGRPEEPKAYAQVLVQLSVIAGSRSRMALRQEMLSLALSEVERAVALLAQAVDCDPATQFWKDAQVKEWGHLALVHLRCGEPEAALAALRQARDLAEPLIAHEGPQPRWLWDGPHMGPLWLRALVNAGRHDEVLALVERVQTALAAQASQGTLPAGTALAQQAGRHARILPVLLATSLHAQGRHGQALALLQQALPPLETQAEAARAVEPADRSPHRRESLLNLAEAHRLMALLQPTESARWQMATRQCLQAAAAITPLAGPALTWWQEVEHTAAG